MLKKAGAKITAFDPKAIKKAKQELSGVDYCDNAYEAIKDADCLVLATDWPQFSRLDLKRVKRLLKRPIIADGRNMFDPVNMKRLGFQYTSIGRSA